MITMLVCYSQVNDELCDLMGVKCNVTNVYHPQSNGLDERFNQTLQRQLLKYISKEETQWDLYLDSILFSYCVSRQDSTRHSPFYLVYGRNAKLPIEFDSVPTQESESGKKGDNNHNENDADEIDSCIKAHE